MRRDGCDCAPRDDVYLDMSPDSCPLAHCDSPPASLVTTKPRKFSLSVDGGGLYWLEQTPFPTIGFSLYSCPLSGCAAGVDPQRLGSDRIYAYVASPDYVYWGEYDQKTASGVTPSIFRAPKPARSGE